MRNNAEHEIEQITQQLKELKIQQRNIDRNIREVEQQVRTLNNTATLIDRHHIGRRCSILNPHSHQPAEGVIVGFTRGTKPFVKVRVEGYLEVRRLPKNLELIPETVEATDTNQAQ